MRSRLLLGCLMLGGCAAMAPAPPTEPVVDDVIRPPQRPERIASAVRPPAGARTAEQFDTTTAEQRAEAAAPAAEGERALGRTVASLGAPTEPGFWLKTPLVTRETPGRVVYPATGKSSSVTLIPIDGPRTAGSRLSLAAFRLIGASLTDLPEIEVYSGG